MTDGEFTMFVFLWIFGGIILFQWWRIHRYRNKIERIALNGLAAPKAPELRLAAEPAPAAGSEEFEALKKRVQVLERIATDASPTLERELDELRRAG